MIRILHQDTKTEPAGGASNVPPQSVHQVRLNHAHKVICIEWHKATRDSTHSMMSQQGACPQLYAQS